MPIMIIRARDVSPSTASERPEDTHASNELWQAATRSICEAVE